MATDSVGLHRGVGGDVGLVGEVEASLGERLRLHQLLAPRLVKRPRPTLRLRDRLARLRLGLGGDEIGKALDLGEIDPPVLEGAARELARLGKAHATERSERLDHAADHGAAAMNMQLGDVLSSEARGPRQPEREPAVEHLAGPRVPDLAQARLARRRRRTAQRAERVSRSRPRNADDRDACPARRARQRADGVGLGHGIRRRMAGLSLDRVGYCRGDWRPDDRRTPTGTRGRRKSSRPGDEPLSPPAPGEPRQLVGLGARGARRGQADGKADPALGRLRRLPLVPRDGA